MATKRFYYNLQGFSDLFVDLTDGSNPVLMYRVEGGDLNVLPTKGKDGEDGEDGKSCYVYWAWCEDPATGSGFSLTTPAKYISFIKSETPIASPAFGDFSIWGQQRGDDGQNGDDGVSSYLYIAYASDSAGTGFSLTWSNGLKYRAEIISRTEIATPTLSDFANATWAKFIGDASFNADQFTVDEDGYVSLKTRQVTSTNGLFAVDYVKEWETYSDGSWYRLWASGWLEQGYGGASFTTNNKTITLLKEYKDTNYSIHGVGFAISGVGGQGIKNVTTTSFTTYSDVKTTFGRSWMTCGWAAE